MKSLNLIILLCLTRLSVFAQQTGTVIGVISDQNNVVPGVTVRAGDQVTATNTEGEYSLVLQEGSHELETSLLGYKRIIRKMRVTGGAIKKLDLTLEEDVNPMEEI